nr:hypothetical protein [Gemmata palustris]
MTKWIATSGGKDRRSARALAIGESGHPVLAKAFDPLVQMPALHRDQPARRRNRNATGQKQDGACAFGESRCNAGASQQAVEFVPLLRGNGNDSLTLCHWSNLAQEVLGFAILRCES